MKHRKFLLAISLVGLTLAAMTACGGAAPTTSAPTQPATTAPATAAPTGTPVPPASATASVTPELPTPTATAAATGSNATVPAPSGYDGQWEGKSSTDSPIQFTIENNLVTYLNINYAFQSGGCSVSGALANVPEHASISGNDIAAQITDSEGVQYSITGTFTSSVEASGTLEVKGKTFCGDTDAKATWTAKNTSTPSTSGDSATPTEVAQGETPTAESSDSDPANILATFFISVDTKNVDDAMALVSDDVVFNIGSTSGVGKAQLKAYLQDQVDQGVVFLGGDVTVTGNVVNFSVQVTGATEATFDNSLMIVEDGKITILTLK